MSEPIAFEELKEPSSTTTTTASIKRNATINTYQWIFILSIVICITVNTVIIARNLRHVNSNFSTLDTNLLILQKRITSLEASRLAVQCKLKLLCVDKPYQCGPCPTVLS